MKRIFQAVAVLLLASQAGAASDTQQALALERSVWLARTGFHQLALGGNASEDIAALQRTLSQGRREAEALADTLPEDQAQSLRQTWRDYEQRAMNNPLATLGYADYDALSNLNRLTWILARRAQDHVVAPVTGEDLVMQARVVLHRLASEYLALASFPSAGLNNGVEGAESMSFRQEVMTFDQLLVAMQPLAQDSGSKRMLSQVQLRWDFVRDSLLEMEQSEVNRVPMLLYRYSLQIDRDLARLADASDAGQ